MSIHIAKAAFLQKRQIEYTANCSKFTVYSWSNIESHIYLAGFCNPKQNDHLKSKTQHNYC